MNWTRSNREAISSAVLGAAATGSMALLTLYWSKRKQQAIRRASVSCNCGKFKAEIYQPAANYKYADTINMQCGCHDCVGACKAILEAGKSDKAFRQSYFDPGVAQVLFYDSEVDIVQGSEHLEHMKLSTKTENRRVFAGCCGSPISVSPDHSHLNLVYCSVVQPTPEKECGGNEIPFPAKVLDEPTVLLHASSLEHSAATVDKTRHPNMQVVSGAFAPATIFSIISRLVLLLGMGDRGPGKGFPVAGGKEVGIGYESIPAQMR